jgi:aspartyl-tRNA(Asn)/glutamyl-tRNA(Gln) amidotransferase subunit C
MLTKETVEKVSTLARLKLTEAEIAAFSLQLSAVLENFEQIAQVDTKDIRPLLTPTDMSMTLRPDIAEKVVESEKLLSNAPEKSGRLFRVPPVV